ncbi:hypothetical protein M433DRAFT_138225 [Acidomyces richmondensis BFW]|nr:hypothetical protein M433DRAFT_138225 [Acidomyces richmondensis BFW]
MVLVNLPLELQELIFSHCRYDALSALSQTCRQLQFAITFCSNCVHIKLLSNGTLSMSNINILRLRHASKVRFYLPVDPPSPREDLSHFLMKIKWACLHKLEVLTLVLPLSWHEVELGSLRSIVLFHILEDLHDRLTLNAEGVDGSEVFSKDALSVLVRRIAEYWSSWELRQRDDTGRTYFSYAARSGMKTLIQRTCTCDWPGLLASDGYVEENLHERCVPFSHLINNSVWLETEEGDTPLHLAIKTRYIAVVYVLLDQLDLFNVERPSMEDNFLPNACDRFFYNQDHNGNSILHLVLETGETNWLFLLLQHYRKMPWEFALGALGSANRDLKTPIDLAMKFRHKGKEYLSMAKMLIKFAAQLFLNIQLSDGTDPWEIVGSDPGFLANLEDNQELDLLGSDALSSGKYLLYLLKQIENESDEQGDW